MSHILSTELSEPGIFLLKATFRNSFQIHTYRMIKEPFCNWNPSCISRIFLKEPPRKNSLYLYGIILNSMFFPCEQVKNKSSCFHKTSHFMCFKIQCHSLVKWIRQRLHFMNRD